MNRARVGISRAVLLALGLLMPTLTRADDLKIDVKAGLPPTDVASTVGVEKGCTVSSSAEGLRITIPEASDQRGPVGLLVKRTLVGDFEVVASYESFLAGPPAAGYGAGLLLVIELDDAMKNSLTIERQTLPKEGDVFTSTHIFTPAAGGDRKYDPRRAPAKATTGRLKLARSGGKVTASYDEGGEFRVLREVELGTGDVTLLRLAASTGQTACAVDVVVTDLQVKAASLASLREPAPAPVTVASGSSEAPAATSGASSGPPYLWLAAGAGIVVLVALAVKFWRGSGSPAVP